MTSADLEPSQELQQIAAALRAHLEWQAATGAVGLPRAAVESARQGEARAPELESVPVRSGSPQPARPVADTHSFEPPPRMPPPTVERNVAPLSQTQAAAAPPMDSAERKRRLEVLAEQIKTCTLCGLHAGRTQTVFARGTGSSRLCFVGEGPGADEDAQGFPFVGKAGQLLDRMIAAMGFARDEVYVCNIVKCRPPNNRKPEPEEMAACMPYLAQQLELLNPEVIVALGATAVQGLLGTSEGIMRLRGKWKLYKGRIPVMPTFHPAYLLRTPAAKREVWDDLQAVLRQMGRSAPKK